MCVDSTYDSGISVSHHYILQHHCFKDFFVCILLLRSHLPFDNFPIQLSLFVWFVWGLALFVFECCTETYFTLQLFHPFDFISLYDLDFCEMLKLIERKKNKLNVFKMIPSGHHHRLPVGVENL